MLYIEQIKHTKVILCPTIARFLSPKMDREVLVERTEEYIGYTPIHNSPGNGMFAMFVPLFAGKSGPVVILLPGKEETMFNLAYQLESAVPWIDRLPLKTKVDFFILR